jgi:perosamine synthetase
MLAIDGGAKVRIQPFPRRRLFGEEEKQAAMALFDQAIEAGEAFLYNGPQETAYEQEFAQFQGGGHADGVNSGSSAVFAALGALNLEPWSEVICPPITDCGGMMPVAMLNCVPVVADSAPGSYNVGVDQIATALTRRTRAIIVAHIAGEPVEMEPILQLAEGRGLPVLEDCAQAHGARYRGSLVGTMGTIAAFSTMGGKHHATGGQGGVVYTRREDLHLEGRRFADRGKPFGLPGHSNVRLGLNLNSNELAAAIGRVQLRRLPEIVASRRRTAERIVAGIAGGRAVSPGWQPADSEASYWFLRLHLELDRLTVSKEQFCATLKAEGIPCTSAYVAIPSDHEWFREQRTFGTSGLPWSAAEYDGERHPAPKLTNARQTTATCFSLSVHENWGEQEAADVVEALCKVEQAYRR